MPMRIIELLHLHAKWKNMDRILLFIFIVVVLGMITLIGKRNFVPINLSYQVKLTVFSGLIVLSTLLVVAIEWFCRCTKWEKIDRMLLFIYTFVLLGIFIWFGNNIIWHNLPITSRLIIASGLFLITITMWLNHDISQRWINILQDRITIWVWLFSIWLLFSVLLVVYNNWFQKSYDENIEKIVQSSETYKNRPNIILITFDALTSEDMSAYGYYRDTTPFITEWAKKASLFSRTKSSDIATAPTTASLMTGKRIWSHRVFHNHGYIVFKGETENIPILLKQNGYYTMGYMAAKYSVMELGVLRRFFDTYSSHVVFQNNLNYFGHIDKTLSMLFGKNIKLYDWIIKDNFILSKFVTVIDKTLLGGVSGFQSSDRRHGLFYDIDKQFNKVLEDIGNGPPEPFFTWVHLYPPHTPYDKTPEPYKGIFTSSLTLKGKNLSEEEKKNHDIVMNRARYDEYIKFCDEKFKEFIEDKRLKKHMNNTVIILSSDHGMLENPVLHKLLVNIPLIIKEPDREEGLIVNDLVEQIDIPATILDLAKIPIPYWIEGRSLVPIMRGKRLSPKRAFSVTFQGNSIWDIINKGSIAVWEGDYKLIHILEKNKSFLYNIKEDPDELKNIFYIEKEIGQHLLNVIHKNLERANEKIRMGE
jgi:arylsulfatase A-like enzyme